MRIGLDIDDTICKTTEIVHNRIEIFAEKHNLNPLDVMNDEYLKQEFFDDYLEDIYKNVEVKKNAKEVLRRLKNKGNKIYIITSRNNHMSKKVKDVEKLTIDWLAKNDIIIDEIEINAYGDGKASACRKYKIDLMIDDNPYNFKKIIATGTKCLLFDDRGRYDMKGVYMSTWNDIESYIERNYENEKNS